MPKIHAEMMRTRSTGRTGAPTLVLRERVNMARELSVDYASGKPRAGAGGRSSRASELLSADRQRKPMGGGQRAWTNLVGMSRALERD